MTLEKKGNALPKVTVLMPVYNGATYLREAIDSILAQTYMDFELLIVNDGSTDTSNEIIAAYSDPRIKCIENIKNLGLVASLNKGLKSAQGEYIARMDQDDISLPERLKKQFDFMIANPNIGVLGTGFKHINNKGVIRDLPSNILTDHDFIKWSLHFYSPLVHPTVMMNKKIIRGIGGYSPLCVHAEDYDLWIRASKVTRISNLEEKLLLLRKHDGNYTKTYLEEHKQVAINICHSMATDCMKENIDPKFIAILLGYKCPSANEALETSTIVYKLYCKHYKSNSCSKRGAQLIRKDAGSRLFGLVQPFIRDSSIWRIVMISISLNPSPFMNYTKAYIANHFKMSKCSKQ